MRSQAIKYLTNLNEFDADRICDRLQQCNVRVTRINGDVERDFTIRTRWHLVNALTNDASIKHVEYLFNGKWEKIL